MSHNKTTGVLWLRTSAQEQGKKRYNFHIAGHGYNEESEQTVFVYILYINRFNIIVWLVSEWA